MRKNLAKFFYDCAKIELAGLVIAPLVNSGTWLTPALGVLGVALTVLVAMQLDKEAENGRD